MNNEKQINLGDIVYINNKEHCWKRAFVEAMEDNNKVTVCTGSHYFFIPVEDLVPLKNMDELPKFLPILIRLIVVLSWVSIIPISVIRAFIYAIEFIMNTILFIPVYILFGKLTYSHEPILYRIEDKFPTNTLTYKGTIILINHFLRKKYKLE